MYYKLKESYRLRGWKMLPYALVNAENGRVEFCTKEVFDFLLRCDGQTDLFLETLTANGKRMEQLFLEHGIIEKCEAVSNISDEQRYRFHVCRYVGKAHWAITGRCNYRCRHCYLSAPDAVYGELSTEQCLRIIDGLSEAGIQRVSLTGGEALTRKDFFQLVDYLTQKRIFIDQIYTNGALLNGRFLDRLKERGLRPEMALSFDGLRWHDWLRGVEGSERHMMEVFRMLRERGFSMFVELALHRRNRETFLETLEMLDREGVDSLKVSPAFAAGSWKNEPEEYTLTKEEVYQTYLESLPFIRAKRLDMSIQLDGFVAYDGKKRDISFLYADGCSVSDFGKVAVCRGMRNSLYITPEGKAQTCPAMTGAELEERMPSLLETPLTDILTRSAYLELMDCRLSQLKEKGGKCATCEHLSVCKGSCRARAVLEHSDFYAPDEWACFFFENNYREKITQAWGSL